MKTILKRNYKIGLVILTLNEIEGITLLWPKIPKKYFNEILAIDAGSTDGMIEFYPSTFCKKWTNFNKWEAMRFSNFAPSFSTTDQSQSAVLTG
jgi:hypothetical protein